ncbi:MAG: outer membrane beta-barrel protein [Vicinamibacterales bacterium]
MPVARRVWPLVLLLLLGGVRPAAAADWLLTPYIGIWFGGGTSLPDLDQATDTTQTGVGVSAALFTEGWLGLEAEASYVPRFFDAGPGTLVTGSRVFTLTGNLLLAVPRSVTRESLQPYVAVGGGLLNVHLDDLISALDVRSTMPAISVGGGAIGMLSPKTGIRFDFRYVRSVGTGGDLVLVEGPSLRYWRGSIGYVRRF